MSSFISHFKWLGATFACFVAIELAISWWAPRPEAIRNNFLAYDFAKPELVQRAFVAAKVRQFDDSKPDFLQVGDSSGLHAVQSPIVESYLGGRSYLNMSIATNLGYWGYYALAEHFMARSGSVKVLVLYFTPAGGSPRKDLLDASDLMAGDLNREFASPFHRLFHVPSLGLRRQITDWVYYMDGTLNQVGRPLIDNYGYLMLRDIIAASGGWARETDIPDDHIDGLFQMARRISPTLARLDDDALVRHYRDSAGVFGVPSTFDAATFSYRTYLEIVLDRYLALARRYRAKLVIATNPIPDSFRKKLYQQVFDPAGISRAVRAYAQRNPDVYVLDIDYWPDDEFSVFSHVGTPYEVESSRRVGQFLAGIARTLPAPTSSRPEYRAPDPVVLDMRENPTVYGLGDLDQVGGRYFRSIRQGRYEGLVYTRVNPETPQVLRMSVLNELDDPVLRNLSIGIYGEPAKRLADEQIGAAHYLRFALPLNETRRYDGWIELTISVRGAVKWQGNQLFPDATGPRLKMESIEIGPDL